jgi:hypothetical protein
MQPMKAFFEGQRVITADTSIQRTGDFNIHVTQHTYHPNSMCLKNYILSYCTRIGRVMVPPTFAGPLSIIP